MLELLGLTRDTLNKLKEWSRTRAVTLRLHSREKCVFDRKETRKVESDTKHVTNYLTNAFKGTISSKVVHKITEWFWKFDVDYTLFAYRGNEPDGERVVLRGRAAHYEIVTTTEDAPRLENVVRENRKLKSPFFVFCGAKPRLFCFAVDVSLLWLLQQLGDDADLSVDFRIDRHASTCFTPRRNAQVDAAMGFFQGFHAWSSSVSKYFRGELFPIQVDSGLDTNIIWGGGKALFVPVVPLFDASAARTTPASGGAPKSPRVEGGKGKEEGEKKGGLSKLFSKGLANVKGVVQLGARSATPDALRASMAGVGMPAARDVAAHDADAQSPLLVLEDVAAMLDEQRRAISEKCHEMDSVFPGADAANAKLISIAEARFVLATEHSRAIAQAWKDGVDYIEHMVSAPIERCAVDKMTDDRWGFAPAAVAHAADCRHWQSGDAARLYAVYAFPQPQAVPR